MSKPQYSRILLKLSGEALLGKQSYGSDPDMVQALAEEIVQIHSMGTEIAIVIGGGNIYRGVAASVKGIDRSAADYMGMLATVINGLTLQDALEKRGVFTRVMTAMEIPRLAELYIRRRAIRHLEKGRVVIMVAGTGNPYFTTDTAAALRAMEIDAQIILKATKVDGIYSDDPVTNKQATRYEKVSYLQVLKEGLKVMDATAISLCMENNLPIIVFSIMQQGNIKKVLCGEKIGSLVMGD